jgi:REP element-mobilizing transposase RayT
MGEEYFKNKYRVASTRLGHWDYADEGFYYVTICTNGRVCNLGEIKENNVYLSEVGKIVLAEWLKTQTLRPNVILDDFIIMPNHIHGIIVIQNDQNVETPFIKNVLDADDFGHPQGRDTVHRVSTERKFGGLSPKSLSSIINTFKGAVSRNCHTKNLNFQWQDNYYEHIIKDDEDYARIKEYIALNPIKWAEDKNNPINIKK